MKIKLKKIFKQSVLGLALTATIAPVAYTHAAVSPPGDVKCQVIEKEIPSLHYNSSDSLPTFHVYNYEQKTVHHISARDGVKTVAAAALGGKERVKYEDMKQRLPSACKQKLGLK